MKKVENMEKDSFWNVEKLIPQKKSQSQSNGAGKSPRLTEICIRDEQNVPSETAFSLPEREKQEPPRSYSYEKLSSLIRHVEVFDWKNSYHYYEYFCKNALYFRDKKGERCQRVPFFSYVAQYSQMSREQLAWYLWWRENAREGVYLDTDVTYILLYYYEIINLGDTLNTEKALSDMIGVWAHYRGIYPQLDVSVAEWICDYSLIHKIPIPFPHKLITRQMIEKCSLREIYYSFDPSDWTLYAKFLLTYCNSYNYRRSKFYTDETAELYDRHIVGALSCLLRENPTVFLDGRCHMRKASRVAFTGALCSYRMRKKIEVEYLSLSDTEELRDQITSVIKYCENKLRVHLGIRSRLGIRELDHKVMAVLDAYYLQNGIALEQSKVPEYEKLYNVQDLEFSLDKAMEIERSSWNMTAKLVDDCEENVSGDTQCKPMVSSSVTSTHDEPSPQEAFAAAIAKYSEFFEYVLNLQYDKQKEYCRSRGLLLDAVVDKINELAVEYFEDVLIEEVDGGYAVIEEYTFMFEDKGDTQ